MTGEPISTSAIVAHWLLAFFWAIVHALNSHRGWKSKTFIDFLILVVMSSFAWVMFTIIWLHIFPTSTYLVYAMSGTWGFIGIEWMGIIINFIKTKLK